MRRRFIDFMDTLRGLETPDKLRDAMQLVVEDAGFKHFMCLSTNDRGEVGVLTTYPPEWVDRYGEAGYADIDPTVEQAARSLSTFTWDGAFYEEHGDESVRRLFAEAREYGVRRGMAVVWDNRGGRLTGMSIVTDRPAEDFRCLVKEQGPDLQLAALYFMAHARETLGGRLPAPPAPAHSETLNARERECLRLLAEGTPPAGIARHTGSADAAVRARLATAMHKLGAPSPEAAAAHARERGLLSS